MKNKYLLIFILLSLSSLPAVFAAHWIVGYVQNSTDGTSPNGRLVKLWNAASGSDEITGLIGPSGPSITSNVYMIDCELLNTSCSIGDNLSLSLIDDFSGYVGLNNATVNVTGSGFDVAGNLSMNSPPNITNVTVDDSYLVIPNEIDLTPASTTLVYCTGIIEELDNFSSLYNVTAQFYQNTSSYGQADDNNNHYTNNSCSRNDSFGNENQTSINCSFTITYYANAGGWLCTLNASDTFNASRNQSDTTIMNTLLALGTDDLLNFSRVNATQVTQELPLNLTNYGNVRINLSLSGYGNVSNDGNSMDCTGGNISIGFTKYNITSSNPGVINLSNFSSIYKNLTSNAVIEPFNLNNRQNDAVNDAVNTTYWRVYVPRGVGVSCSGNIVLGATRS